MPITLRHINADSTWLITLTSPSDSHVPFRILIDPWLDFPSPVYHPKFSVQMHSVPCAISSLAELPHVPDIVVISQDKSDHCHESTCRQLPKDGVKVYAVPGADKTVRSWNWFDKRNVISLKNWRSRAGGRVEKVYIYKRQREEGVNSDESEDNPGGGGSSGSGGAGKGDVAAIVEIAYLPALRPWEMPNLHAAISITYTPVNTVDSDKIAGGQKPPSPLLTPPLAETQSSDLPTASATSGNLAPPKKSLRKSLSASSVFSALSSSNSENGCTERAPCPKGPDTLSIVYSPHGVNANVLVDYLSTVPRPLTLLLHCFDHIQNPWWLGGNISTGAGTMLKLLEGLRSADTDTPQDGSNGNTGEGDKEDRNWELGVKYWVSTHDEEKILGGFTSGYVRKRRWLDDEVKSEVQKLAGKENASAAEDREAQDDDGVKGLQVLQIGVDETVVLS